MGVIPILRETDHLKRTGPPRTGRYVPCVVCGREVWRVPAVLNKVKTVTCSRACKAATLRVAYVEKMCPECGEPFKVPPGTAHRYTVCSWKCRTARGRTIPCETCGAPVWQKPAETRKHCSEECRRPPVMERCRNCDEEFRRLPSETARQFFCFACYRAFRGENLLERRVRNALDTLAIDYSQEHRVGRWSADFAIPEKRIAIEVDGTYWHNPAKDQIRDRAFRCRGWTVVRIQEEEISAAADLGGLILAKLQTPHISKS